MTVVRTGLTRPQARFAEQIIISAYRAENSNLDNARREIAERKIESFIDSFDINNLEIGNMEIVTGDFGLADRTMNEILDLLGR